MNDTEREVVARRVANHIIEDLMYEPLPPMDLKAAALDIVKEIISADPTEFESIARLALTAVMNDNRVATTKTPMGNIMWFERKSV